ncbi:MAG: alpha/beta hydrolase [Ktedonobacteraceae bacterium]
MIQKDRCIISQILHINIPMPVGHLEGILKPAEENTQPYYAALVCHPHPLGGGTMHNKVVFKTAQVLQTLGLPALRFNFRGVGHSTGTYDEGRGEMDDVHYALDFLSHRYPSLPIILAGFSFGAWVGLRVACEDDRVQAMIGLGTPVRLFEHEYLEDCHKPKLFIHGTLDELAPFDLAQRWFEHVPAPKVMIPVEGADHFFQDRMDEVQAMIASFAQSVMR